MAANHKSGTVSKREQLPIAESTLQHIWNNLPAGSEFTTPTRQPVKIISPGIWNSGAGPDFLTAKINIDGTIFTGAVEIHLRASDWYNHGHQNNSDYHQVILHAVAINDLTPEQLSSLPPLVVIDWKAQMDNSPKDKEKIRPGKCHDFFDSLTRDEIAALLYDAGQERFYQKSRTILGSIISNGIEKTAVKLLFEAMGYQGNRSQFLELWRRFEQYDHELRKRFTAAILWGESGLLPEITQPGFSAEMKNFVEQCWQEWWSIRITAHPAITWKRHARPVSRPERRIAALIAILQRCHEQPMAQFSQLIANLNTKPADLLNSLIIHDKLWDKYASFNKPRRKPAALLGYYSALELVVNIYLPLFAAVAKLNQQPVEPIVHYWSQLPPIQHNSITRLASKRWFGNRKDITGLMNTTATRQGIIHLTREFCDSCHGFCDNCLLYNSTAGSMVRLPTPQELT